MRGKQGIGINKKIESELQRIYPGVPKEKLCQQFLHKKKKKIILLTGCGIFLLFVYFIKSFSHPPLIIDGKITRREWGNPSQYIHLDAQIGEEEYEKIPLEILAKEWTEEEVLSQMEQIFKDLPEIMKGKNASLKEVRKPLQLIKEIEGVPIQISWKTDSTEYMDEEGNIGTTVPVGGMEVLLTAICQYEEIEREQTYIITVFPRDPCTESIACGEIEEFIKKEEKNQRKEDVFLLPTVFKGREIVWRESRDFTGLWIFILLIFADIFLLIGADEEIHKKYEKRNQLLLLDYAKFVGEIQLMIGSGMSIRGTLIQMGREYQRKKKQTGNESYLYEELLQMIKMLENGSSETEALQAFSKRIDLPCYRKMVTVMIQNLKHGTEGLNQKLKEEVANAFEERKLLAKRLGEEAETKLLLPMMLMLGVVLLLILVPAYFSFGSI